MTAMKKRAGKVAQRKRRADDVAVPVLQNEIMHLTCLLQKHVDDTQAFRKETREEIAAINQLLSRYKGALGLLALIGSAVLTAVGLIIPYFISRN